MAIKTAPKQASEQKVLAAKMKSRTKTKGACRTCKIRKVKCDEGRPCCYRCSSTGRICEGYGIWGGGDADTHYTAIQQTYDIYRCIGLSSSLANSSPDEKHYFEWFRCRTTTKLPGVFGSGFWEVLVLQVTHSESAALHAILAVACAHKRLPKLAKSGAYSDECSPDEQERFMLQHYSKAISDVQKCFSTNDRASVRVVLIVCMLFVILEFMRGRTRSGIRHLLCGMKVINSFETRKITASTDNGKSPPSQDTIDKWLLGAFSRLNLQALLFGQICASPRAAWQISSQQPFSDKFDSLPHARDTLDDLLIQVLELTEAGAREDVSPEEAHYIDLLARQKTLQIDLERWSDALRVSKEFIHSKYGFLAPVAYQSLLTRCTAAKVIADRCLSHGNEGSYDRNTAEFLAIIAESIKTWKFCMSRTFASTRYAHKADVAPFVVDGAWIWPLYYTAIKCRVRRIRVQSLRLLESTYSMEAVCDSTTAAAIAREVVEIEEPGLCDNDVLAGDFDFLDEPRAEELLPPALPASSRLFDVQVTLPNLPSEMAMLSYKRKTDDSSYDVLTQEFDSVSQCWVNKKSRREEFMD